MNEKILNLYSKMECVGCQDGGVFKSVIMVDDKCMNSEISCSKYAKFLTNDFKALENKVGTSIYTTVDPLKLRTLFSISEQYNWFNRKELVEFIDYYISRDVP